MTVEDQGRAGGVADFGRQDGQAATFGLADLDTPGLEPALDETGCLVDSLRSGGVVGDQAPGQREELGLGQFSLAISRKAEIRSTSLAAAALEASPAS